MKKSFLSHSLCAVTITKVFDTSVKRSVEFHLNWSWFICVCKDVWIARGSFWLKCPCTWRFVFHSSLLCDTHGCFQLQQDGETRSRLGLPSAQPSHQPSWLGPGQDLPVWPLHHSSNRVHSPPRADPHPRRSSQPDLRTHYAFPSMPQLHWSSLPMPRLPPRVPSPRPWRDLDTQDLELPCIPAPHRPRAPRPLSSTWVPTTPSPWLGPLWTCGLPKLGLDRSPWLLVYHLLLPAQHQRQDTFVRHALPGHPTLPHQPGLLALRGLHQAFLERNRGATLDVPPGHTISRPTIRSQLLRRRPSPTTTSPTPEESNSPQTSSSPCCPRTHWGPDLYQLCAAQHSTAIDHSPRIPTVRTGHTTSISPTNRLRPHQTHIILPATDCHTECHTDFVHTTDASPEHTEPISHQRSTLHSSGPSVSIVHHTMATNVHSGDRPMGRTRFRRPSCPCSQPPRHSSSQFGTIPGPPDQPSGIPLQFLHTAYPEGILPRLHQLPVLRQRPIRPIRQLADPHPTSGWHLCTAPSELQRRRIFQHNDVVGTLVPTNLTPPRPTGVHRTDTHDSTPHQHRRPRDCHSDQLLLYQDEPRTSIGFPDQPQQSRRDLSDLPERMAEFRRRSISAFPQPKRHICQIQLQRGLRDLRSPQCQHSGTPKGVGRQRPEHPG